MEDFSPLIFMASVVALFLATGTDIRISPIADEELSAPVSAAARITCPQVNGYEAERGGDLRAGY